MVTGRRERRKERTRRALLAAGLELFAKRGIYATRLEDITQAADLGKGAFYNYFASKDDLTAALLEEAVDLLHRVYLLNVSAHSAPLQRVVEIARCHRDFFDEHPVYLLLFHQAQGLMLLRQGDVPAMKRVFAAHLSRLGALIPTPGEAHRWSKADREDIAAVLAGTLMGYRSVLVASGLPGDPRTIEGLLTGSIADMLEARKLA